MMKMGNNHLNEISKHLDEVSNDMKEINWGARSIVDIINNVRDLDKVLELAGKILAVSEKYVQ